MKIAAAILFLAGCYMGNCSEIAVNTTYPKCDPEGFLYDQTSFFIGDTYHVQDLKNALAYRMSAGSRETFIKFYTPCGKTRTVVDDEFSSTTQPSVNEYADENAALYDAAKKYYDAGCPFRTSMQVHLDRYNAENGIFITDCTADLPMVDLGQALSPIPELMPKDWRGFHLTSYLLGNNRAFSYLKIAPDLAEKLVAAVGPSRSLRIDFVCRRAKFPLKDIVANSMEYQENPGRTLIVCRDTVILPSAIITYKISGVSDDVEKIAANITLVPYSRTESEQAFEQKVHMKIMAAGDLLQYVFFPNGELRYMSEEGYTMGRWYIIKGKLYVRLNSNPRELTGIPFEFAANGDLVLTGVHYASRGTYEKGIPKQWDLFSDEQPQRPALLQQESSSGQAGHTDVAETTSKPAPIDSIVNAFAAAAASHRPLYGKSGKDSCSLEITSVQGDSFSGVYHDSTSGFPFSYTVEGKVSKDSASFTAVSWVQKPSIAPENDNTPGSGCGAEFKLGANGLCTGKVRYKTWERSALTVDLSGNPLK